MDEKDSRDIEGKIYTGLWDKSSEDAKEPFIKLFSDEYKAGQFHKIYFQWYNIIHEFCHILRDQYGIQVDWSKEGASEEQTVNDFAAAYWKKFGESSKLEFIMNEINGVLERIPNSVPKGEEFLHYFNTHFGENMSSVELYGFLQFTCVKRAFDSSETLSEVLNRFGIKNNDICEKKLIYTDGYQPQTIVDDCCKILNEMGVKAPKVEVILLDDPLMQRAE